MHREEIGIERGVHSMVTLRAFNCSQRCTCQIASVPRLRHFPDFCINFNAVLFMVPELMVVVSLTLCDQIADVEA